MKFLFGNMLIYKILYGLVLEIYKPCADGSCSECEMEDFNKCTLCKPGFNRILVNKECICQEGSYDPLNDDSICIVVQLVQVLQIHNILQNQNQIIYTQSVDESISNRISKSNSCPFKQGYADFIIKRSKCGKCHPQCQTYFQVSDETTNQYYLICIPGQNRYVSDFCDCTCGILNDFETTHFTSCSEDSNSYLTTFGECLCKTSYYEILLIILNVKYAIILVYYVQIIMKNACQQCPQTRISADLLATQFECVCASLHIFDDGFQSVCQECESCLTCDCPLLLNC
ncbi:unnamed protein product [Paramecium sonneborni]|uniref:Transmembrane protein n=1 Tax=Paramecium sonneborni TaxID=65129 RepID=A0A8S1L319_9CILI|nr:unnamed protein product [Paramecium sonneborni]